MQLLPEAHLTHCHTYLVGHDSKPNHLRKLMNHLCKNSLTVNLNSSTDTCKVQQVMRFWSWFYSIGIEVHCNTMKHIEVSSNIALLQISWKSIRSSIFWLNTYFSMNKDQ